MKENVGKKDRLIRSIAGPALIGIGYTALDGRKGNIAGLATIVAGALLAESALTKVCPVNGILGIDTRENKGTLQRIKKVLE